MLQRQLNLKSVIETGCIVVTAHSFRLTIFPNEMKASHNPHSPIIWAWPYVESITTLISDGGIFVLEV